jgi:Uncharacterized ACR, COG1430
MGEGWLLRDGKVLASTERPETFAECVRVLVTLETTTALALPRWCSAHTFGSGAPMDVAFLDWRGDVMALVRLSRKRFAFPRPRARTVLMAPSGSFERWQLQIGDSLEFRDMA